MVADFNRTLSMCNVLMFLSNPDDHEPIVSKAHKEQIVGTFDFILEDFKKEENNKEDSSQKKQERPITNEARIRAIKSKISAFLNGDKTFESFYDIDDQLLVPLWNPGAYDQSFDKYEALQYVYL